jgi:hypothetical protein
VRWISTALVTALALALAPSAFAAQDTTSSSNWAGYAVHRSGVSFRTVSASWTQPNVACKPGKASYSAYWVGLGGYAVTSTALEQIGTEADCNSAGRPVLSAWYELVPAPSTPIAFTVKAGDTMSASVSVTGHQVQLSLYDITRHRGFTKTLQAGAIDVSSAEWIVEAPSSCISLSSCQTLPLANFGTAAFGSLRASATTGALGSALTSAWSATKISLSPLVGHPTASQGSWFGAATPSALGGSGSSFRVSYSRLLIENRRMRELRRTAHVAIGHLVHPVR